MKLNQRILRTKFFVPQPTTDFVKRKLLDTKFERLRERPIMLITASSGYGKSSLTANFLRNQNENHVWLSLGEEENEFFRFVQHFIGSIKEKIENFGDVTLELLSAIEKPSINDLTASVMYDLVELNAVLYMAIDDYHYIKNKDVNEFVERIFEYPQPYFRLIILTRFDPELPISRWRTKNKLVEIRASDLRFNSKEIGEFYSKITKNYPNDNIKLKIEDVTEGWISGIRMLLLSCDSNEELKQNLENFNYKNSKVIRDLVNSVLLRQSVVDRENLLRLSLLREFNADLFAEICLQGEDKKNKEFIFRKFISIFMTSNMFIIPLDKNQNWYRLHHLFSEKLNELLSAEFKNSYVNELRIKIADYYFKNNNLKDAIEYFLNADNEQKAIEVFIKYRIQLISEARFQVLEEVFNSFSSGCVNSNGVLLVTKGWLLLQNGNIPAMAKHISLLDQLLIEENHTQDELNLLLGEIHSMKAFDRYLSDVNMPACLSHSKSAIKLLNKRNPYALGIAWVYYGAAMQHLGKSVEGKKEIYKELEITENPVMKGHLLLILCFLDWFEGDLENLLINAKHILQHGCDSGIKMIIANGNIFAGIAYYYQNNDDKALKYLLESHKFRQFTYLHMSFGTGMALADIYAKESDFDKSSAIIHEYESTALKQGGELFNKITKAASADLGWRYKSKISGLKWAKENDFKDFLPLASLFSPELVQANILALDNDLSSLKLAQDILNNTIPFFKDRNDVNVLIRSYVIQALVYYKQGNTSMAYKTLDLVLSLSNVGHFVRPYIAMGDSMKNLLLEYKNTIENHQHINEILQFFSLEEKPSNNVVLSRREKEILELAESMTNKEVGNKLFISEKTVKTHITNVNKKLKAKSKVEAVYIAKESGLI